MNIQRYIFISLLFLLSSLCRNAHAQMDCIISNQVDSLLPNGNASIGDFEAVLFEVTDDFGNGPDKELGESFIACSTANLKKVYFHAFDFSAQGNLLLTISDGANTNAGGYTQDIFTDDVEIVQQGLFEYFCIPLTTPYPVTLGSQYAMSLGEEGSTATFGGFIQLFDWPLGDFQNYMDLTPNTSGFSNGGTMPLQIPSDILFRAEIGCPNAGTTENVTLVASSGEILNLHDYIEGEDQTGIWEQISGEGGVFDAENGTFILDNNTRISSFRYTVPATGNCGESDSVEFELLTLINIPVLKTWGLITLLLLLMIMSLVALKQHHLEYALLRK